MIPSKGMAQQASQIQAVCLRHSRSTMKVLDWMMQADSCLKYRCEHVAQDSVEHLIASGEVFRGLFISMCRLCRNTMQDVAMKPVMFI